MSDIKPEWIAVGVAALKAKWSEAADTDEDFAEAVIAAVAPLIRADLLDALEDVVNQACSVADDEEGGSHLDSMALGANAHGLRVLAKHGRVVIEHEVGRRVIGRWA